MSNQKQICVVCVDADEPVDFGFVESGLSFQCGALPLTVPLYQGESESICSYLLLAKVGDIQVNTNMHTILRTSHYFAT